MLSVNTFFCASLVSAQENEEFHPFLSTKFDLVIGLYWPKKDYVIRVDGSAPEEEIDFDETLGLNDYETTGSLNFRWRFGQKWSFWGQYWSTDTTGSKALSEDIEWGDLVYKAGLEANGGIESHVARVFAGRIFSSGPQHEFGLGGGVHWLKLSTFLEGQIKVNDDSTEFRRSNADAEFPMPNIGGWYLYSWHPKWIFQARLDWLNASLGTYSGSMWNTQVGIHWQAFENFGVGLYYNDFRLDVDVDKTDWHGKAEVIQRGPFLSFTANW
jgi:hypothetical protein